VVLPAVHETSTSSGAGLRLNAHWFGARIDAARGADRDRHFAFYLQATPPELFRRWGLLINEGRSKKSGPGPPVGRGGRALPLGDGVAAVGGAFPRLWLIALCGGSGVRSRQPNLACCRRLSFSKMPWRRVIEHFFPTADSASTSREFFSALVTRPCPYADKRKSLKQPTPVIE